MFVSGCFSDMLPLGPVGKQGPRKGFFAVWLADFMISRFQGCMHMVFMGHGFMMCIA